MKLSVPISAMFVALAIAPSQAYNLSKTSSVQAKESISNRRAFIQNAAIFASGSALASASPLPALASGGATAGKYTTIPIAKRRYYGRVQAAVHDYLIMGNQLAGGDLGSNKVVQSFFDENSLVVVAAKRKDVNGQCTKKNNDCKGAEVRDSPYNDMKTSMYLLGNAFRINQTKAPDNLPTVRAAKAFIKEMDAMEKSVKAKKVNDKAAIGHYLAALDILDEYLDLVELPPTDSGHYEQEFSREVGDSARIT